MKLTIGQVVCKETVAIASEDAAGIFAYIDDPALAERIVRWLNGDRPRDPARYYIIDMHDDNWDDFYFSFASDELGTLVDADTGARVGYVLKRNDASQRLVGDIPGE